MPAGEFLWRISVRRLPLMMAVPLLLGACREHAQNAANTDTPRARADIVVDSALPMDTLLRRFQAGLEHPRQLSHASPSREELTRLYLDAIARSDTAALRDMHISRAEYAFLYFPVSQMMREPYELPPDVAWLLLSAESGKGISATLRRFGGQRLELGTVRCPGEALREAPNVVWRDCVVRYRVEGGAEREQPLFAAILEREGRFKFFSYATPL